VRILIAEDEPVSRRVLATALKNWGHEVVETTDGEAALKALQAPDAPRLAILDVQMPGIDGLTVCRRAREGAGLHPLYIVILTARTASDNLVAGLQAGADDYIAKPFNREELRARVGVGERILRLQTDLADRVTELEAAQKRERELQELLPLCAYCKKVRNDKNYWERVETALSKFGNVKVTHSICPDCYEKIMKPERKPAEGDAKGA